MFVLVLKSKESGQMVFLRTVESRRELLTFCQSETASTVKPITNRTIPAISRPVPKAGRFGAFDTAGELRMTDKNGTRKEG